MQHSNFQMNENQSNQYLSSCSNMYVCIFTEILFQKVAVSGFAIYENANNRNIQKKKKKS